MNALESLYLTHDVSNEKILEFLQTHHDTHNIIMLETPQRAVQQRLLMRLLHYTKGSHIDAMHRFIQMETLLALTPGILSILQGDEYMEQMPMSVIPPPITLQASVGTLRDGIWITKGPNFGQYQALQTLLMIRKQWKLSQEHNFSVFYENKHRGILCLVLDSDPSLLILLHTQAKVISDIP